MSNLIVLSSWINGKRQFHMWRSSKAEIVIVDVLDAWQRFDNANHRQVGQSKQVLPLREMKNLEIDVKTFS